MTAAPCRAGPMCPAEKCVPGGGAHGPRPTGRYVEPRVGDGVLQRNKCPWGTMSHQRGSAALGTDCRVASLLAMARCVGADDSVRPFCNALPRFRRGRRPVPFPCHSVGDGVLDVPSARQRRAVIPSQCSHWRGNPSPRRGGRLCPPRIPAAKNTFAPTPRPGGAKK